METFITLHKWELMDAESDSRLADHSVRIEELGMPTTNNAN
jgi:hypothetical protein